MNRRDLFKGAAAITASAALLQAGPAAAPVLAAKFTGVDIGLGSITAWVLCQGIDGTKVRILEVLRPDDPRIGKLLLRDVVITGTVSV